MVVRLPTLATSDAWSSTPLNFNCLIQQDCFDICYALITVIANDAGGVFYHQDIQEVIQLVMNKDLEGILNGLNKFRKESKSKLYCCSMVASGVTRGLSQRGKN